MAAMGGDAPVNQNGRAARLFTNTKAVVGVLLAAMGLSSAGTLWLVTQSSTPEQVKEARAEVAEVRATVGVLQLAIVALSDSLRRSYDVQEFLFCNSVPPNARSEMAAFGIDCSQYENNRGWYNRPPLEVEP